MSIRRAFFVLAGVLLLDASAVYAQSTVIVDKTLTETVTIDVNNTIDVKVDKDIQVTKDVTFEGTVDITGTINVTRASLALIDNKQILDNSTVNSTDPINTALLDDDVLELAIGNIQVNLSAGILNAQDNAATLTTADGDDVASDATSFVVQETVFNAITANGDNSATITDQVLENATGNLQVNLTAGIANVQKNALSLSTVEMSQTLSEATAATLQQHSFNNIVSNNPVGNLAQLTDSVFRNASGNIQINLSAGIANAQANTLSVAAGQQ